MQLVAINWHIYVLTGSALALGLIGLMRAVPIVFSSLLGGVFADTHDRRRVLLAAQGVSMLIAVTLGLLTQSGWISAGIIYLLAALAAGAMGFGGPVWQAIAPNLVSREHLTNAMSLINIMRQTARIVGPGLAGFAIAWRGVGGGVLDQCGFLPGCTAGLWSHESARPEEPWSGAPRPVLHR